MVTAVGPVVETGADTRDTAIADVLAEGLGTMGSTAVLLLVVPVTWVGLPLYIKHL